jgi:hypothetical protein
LMPTVINQLGLDCQLVLRTTRRAAIFPSHARLNRLANRGFFSLHPYQGADGYPMIFPVVSLRSTTG